jgi:gliding motility-associated-like protein
VQLITTDTNSCNIADTNYILIRAVNDSAIANINVIETHFGCDSIQLSLLASYTGGNHVWTINSTTTLIGQNVTYTITNFGNYTIEYTLTDSTALCQISDTASHFINFYAVDAVLQASATSGCTPLEVDFTNLSTNATNFIWTDGIGNTGSSQNLPTTVYNQVGNYTYTLIAVDSNSCNFSDTAFINISTSNDSVTANFNAFVLNSCDSLLSIDLTNTSTNGLNFIWDFELEQIFEENPINYTYTLPGTYQITLIAINENLCNPYDTVSQIFTLLPNLEASFIVEPNCVGLPLVLNNNSPIQTSNTTWNFGNGTSSTNWQPELIYDTDGFYTISLTLIDSNTCNFIASDTQYVEITSNPIASFFTDTNYYLYPDLVTFNNTSNNYTNFEWFLGDGTYNNQDETFEHLFNGLYSFTNCLVAYNDYCIDTFCRDLYIDFIRLIGVPNAFSPNGDGLNDMIFVEGEGIVNLNFKIYNRWGEVVFETTDQNIGWDGVYKGVLQEMEVYTYLVDATFIDGENVKLKGNITLLR